MQSIAHRALPKFAFIVFFFLCVSCSSESLSLSDSFLKIYDDANFDLDYDPIDVVEVIDGFVLLTGTDVSNSSLDGIQLIKVNTEGNFERETSIATYVSPVGDMYLNPSDSIVYFFGMNPTTLASTLIGVNTDLEVQSEIPFSSLNYPLSAAPLSDGSFLLQSYDNLSAETEISNVGLDGTFIGGSSYSIGPGQDAEVDVINHLTGASDRPLPFFCGEYATGSYFFNGFYNYSFSTVFTDLGGAPTGVLQGQGVNAGLRAALALADGNFAVAGYQFDENFQRPSVPINTNDVSGASVNLYLGNMAEIKPYSPSKIISYASSLGDYTVFASETKGNQIALYFYEASSASLAGIKLIGFLNPFTLSSIKVAADESILILGTTFVAGRFERILLNKISKKEIGDILN